MKSDPRGPLAVRALAPRTLVLSAIVLATLLLGLLGPAGTATAAPAQTELLPPPGSVLTADELASFEFASSTTGCEAGLANAEELLQLLSCGERIIGDSFSDSLDVGTPANMVRVELIVDDPAAVVATLESIGAFAVDSASNVVNASIKIDDIQTVSALEGVQDMVVPRGGASAVVGQHIELQNIAAALQQYPDLDGSGVTVGLMSDSWDCFSRLGFGNDYALDVAQGELPPPSRVTVVRDAPDLGFSCNGRTDETRGMAQIVFDTAPNANYLVHTALGGKASFANAFRTLRDLGADVIIDDFSYFNQAIYQDDVVALAVEEVAASGVAVVTHAGNNGPYGFATETWTDTDGDNWLEFAPGDEWMSLEIPEGREGRYTLLWDDPYYSVTNRVSDTNLDLYLYQNGSLVSSSTRDNRTGDPYEVILHTNNSSSTTFDLRVRRSSGPVPGALTILPQNIGNPQFEYDGAPTISGHSNSPYSLSTGAVRFNLTLAFGHTENAPMSYSGVGGVELRFDRNGNSISEVRQEPDAMFVHGINTTFFGTDVAQDDDDYPNFFGTSAAAPNAGGLVVLMKQAVLSATPDAMFECIRSTSADMSTPGFDFISGAGFADGLAAVACIRGDVLPTPTPTPNPTSNPTPVPPAGPCVLADEVSQVKSADPGGSLTCTIEVPANATSLDVGISGGTGDADLYVQFGSAPATQQVNGPDPTNNNSSTYCAAWVDGNNSDCAFTNPAEGTWYVTVADYNSTGFQNVDVVGDWAAGGSPVVPTPTSVPSSGGCVLADGVSQQVSASTGGSVTCTIEVPANATALDVGIDGGSGEADLYVQFGSAPATQQVDGSDPTVNNSTTYCTLWANGNTEDCSFTNPAAGTWYVTVADYNNSSFDNVNVVGDWTASGSPGLPTPTPVPPVAGSCDDANIVTWTLPTAAGGSTERCSFLLPAGVSSLTITMDGPTSSSSNEADLYVQRGSAPSVITSGNPVESIDATSCTWWRDGNTETCTFTNPQAGTWHILVADYNSSGFSGISVDIAW